MRSVLIIICSAVFATASASAASLITNGSFEDDGQEISNITITAPYGWDVNVPTGFGGSIRHYNTYYGWSSDGNYSLRLVTSKNVPFDGNEYALVSQTADLTDANEIIFNLNLRSYKYSYGSWNGSLVTAFVKIDSNTVWQSGISDDGISEVNIPVDSYSGIHKLSLGIKVNAAMLSSTSYMAYWDFVKFDVFCGGFGNFAGDLNRDCYVDFADVDVLADNWLRNDLAPAEWAIDALQDGVINLSDFAVLANQWMLCSDWQNLNCVEVPLDLDADINLDGIVNFLDYNILAANWGVPTDLKADIDKSGIVDYKDLAIMNEQWLEKSWLYRY